MKRGNNLTASNSSNKRRTFPGKMGDPRMNRAVEARLKDPGMSLLDALRAGGFTFPSDGHLCGTAVDSDNVQLGQRKNQLNRRLRLERWRQEQQKQPQKQHLQQQQQRKLHEPIKHDDSGSDPDFAASSGDTAAIKDKKRPLTSSPAAINYANAKRRNASPDLDPSASPSSGTRHCQPSSPSPEIVEVVPSAIPPPAICDEAIQQAQVIPLQLQLQQKQKQKQQHRPLTPRPPTPIPLAAISIDGQQTPDIRVEPGGYSATSSADGPDDVGSGGVCQEGVDEEERAKRFLLKTFTIDIDSDPVFTEEEKQEEERDLPPEERAAVLADLRGRRPSLTATATNAVRRNSLIGKFLAVRAVTQENLPSLVPLSIQALLHEMREHVSVLQRQGACAPEVDAAISWDLLQSQSNNDRLELFLRREEMNAKLAAIRFIMYWTKRYELFGRDKFCLPMTLNGAMRDDIRALETGTFRLMPDPDSSGRRILFKANCFNTKDGYTSDSMVRVFWYMLESLLEYPITARKGFVLISWDRETSLWNYDRKLDSSCAIIEGECIPIRFAAVHICHCTNLVINLLKPIVMGMVERRVRNRICWHSEFGPELHDMLGVCGITQDMVPVEMGGTSQFSHLSWVRERIEAGK